MAVAHVRSDVERLAQVFASIFVLDRRHERVDEVKLEEGSRIIARLKL